MLKNLIRKILKSNNSNNKKPKQLQVLKTDWQKYFSSQELI